MEYVSITIAIIALLISGYSVYENRHNNRIGQAPALMGHENESPTEYSYVIMNKGNGPAYFEKVEYFLNLQKGKREKGVGKKGSVTNDNY